MNNGKHINFYRKAARLTQEELARKTSLSREFISLIERDQQSVSLHNLIRICQAMNIKTSELITKMEDEHEQSSENSE